MRRIDITKMKLDTVLQWAIASVVYAMKGMHSSRVNEVYISDCMYLLW